jgi:RsiW-degrading membrane proteinase PrsW (M82 family)
MIETGIKALIAIAPVVVCLIILLRLESHRLIGHQRIVVNSIALDLLQIEFTAYSRLVAPAIEETMKAAVMVYLFRRHRIGFQVDAAIMGFAVGAGFSFIENLFYLYHASDAHYATWMVRGFGTAIMHGGCVALFAVISQLITEHHKQMNPLFYLPGLIAAVILHAVFNHFPVSPVLSTLVTLLIIPTVLFLLFEKNETTIHNFLEMDFDSHRKLLEQLEGGQESGCSTGAFLKDLARIHDTPHVQDMIAYIHVHTELVLSAEGVLLAREEGVDVVVESQVKRKIKHMHALERKIGKTGMHTLNPHLALSKNEFWIIHMFEDEIPEMS